LLQVGNHARKYQHGPSSKTNPFAIAAFDLQGKLLASKAWWRPCFPTRVEKYWCPSDTGTLPWFKDRGMDAQWNIEGYKMLSCPRHLSEDCTSSCGESAVFSCLNRVWQCFIICWA